MKLRKAIKCALVEGKGIKRESSTGVWFLPSNTESYFIIMQKDKPLSGKWNPSIRDLLATDWMVTK